jgi:hypothetical protein
MHGPWAVAAALTLVAPSLASVQEAPTAAPKVEAPASGAKVWIGRHGEIQEYLRTAPIERIVKVGEGVTDPDRAFFVAGGLAESALVKVLPPKRQGGFWESYKSEIAAYELDRLLGLDMVPITVERRIEGLRASVQLWVNDAELLSEVGSRKPAKPLAWAKQVCRQRIFDALTSNIDRNAGNMLVDDDWNLILIDHSRAFATNNTPFLDKINQADREIYDALKALDEATLMERLKPWLFGDSSVRALLERRDKIVERLQRFVQERGEAAVFVF